MSRIVGGSKRGHRIDTPTGDRTRPTSDRVREAVFSAIGSWSGQGVDLAGMSFLDLYAGSGAVGLEAASRGAHPVLLVESDRRAAQLIARNAARLDLDVVVHTADVGTLLAGMATLAADVAWLDPPYEVGNATVHDAIHRLIANGWLLDDGLVICERSTRSEPLTWPPQWDGWCRRYGETTVYYARRNL